MAVARDLLALTKPRVISLLLVTAVAPMYITGLGAPPLSLVGWVLLGGFLMAAAPPSACGSTGHRLSLPTVAPSPGRIPPLAALAFGIGLGTGVRISGGSPTAERPGPGRPLDVPLYWASNTQNIVIGGAAGAFPPLVGYAAMAGHLDLVAFYLFAIIFYWTPPHFWALALLKKGEYAKAGVPMLPVVRGERETKVQMLIYTLILIPLTILPGAVRCVRPPARSALASAGGSSGTTFQLLREAGSPHRRKMYKYSLAYLALLFLAMSVDRSMPREARAEAPEVLILDQPAPAAGMPGR
jgi:protoheme IX farnesyltransferase